jgi:N-acetylmuramoyl-L-alanine amidase
MSYTWLIDAGHGGMINGEYVTAPDKMFEHSPEEIFYEGMFNRQIKDALLRKMWAANLVAIDLCPTDLDLDLDARSDIANIYHREYRNCVGVSLHSNASQSHKGRGFEVHTGPGQTRSDVFAHVLGKILIDRFAGIKYRKGDQPGELDKDSPFWILRKTNSPWILPECLFFDNYEDYRLLIDPDFQARYVDALIAFMQQSENENI